MGRRSSVTVRPPSSPCAHGIWSYGQTSERERFRDDPGGEGTSARRGDPEKSPRVMFAAGGAARGWPRRSSTARSARCRTQRRTGRPRQNQCGKGDGERCRVRRSNVERGITDRYTDPEDRRNGAAQRTRSVSMRQAAGTKTRTTWFSDLHSIPGTNTALASSMTNIQTMWRRARQGRPVRHCRSRPSRQPLDAVADKRQRRTVRDLCAPTRDPALEVQVRCAERS